MESCKSEKVNGYQWVILKKWRIILKGNSSPCISCDKFVSVRAEKWDKQNDEKSDQ